MTDLKKRKSPKQTDSDFLKMFERIHEAGVKRHPQSWITANTSAIHSIYRVDETPDSPKIKTLVSDVVLRVLDALGAE